MKNLWILTEERPKNGVIEEIVKLFSRDFNCGFFGGGMHIYPILDENGNFCFTYKVCGIESKGFDNIFIKTVSGYSSFVDFLVFYQEHEPTLADKPIYAIEETKTDDGESRNTGVFQRCSKFVFIQNFYPEAKKVMLYNLQVEQKKEPTDTYVFGTRLLMTYGVEILGKSLDKDIFKPFESLDEVINFKQGMSLPPKHNIPILIKKYEDRVEVSGRLVKNGTLSHDPNIGQLSIIVAVVRELGWRKSIVITSHGLSQDCLRADNKFVILANVLGIELGGLRLPQASIPKEYWYYERKGEKLGTIFIHIVVENFTSGYSIFENHAGCEKGYFLTSNGERIPLQKYANRERYKAGDKSQKVFIPDLILIDFDRSQVVNIEGKKYQFRRKGIEELQNYDFIEKEYIERYYPKFKILRTVVLYGGKQEQLVEIEVGFLLNERGKLILGVKAPDVFKRAISNLLDFWGGVKFNN